MLSQAPAAQYRSSVTLAMEERSADGHKRMAALRLALPVRITNQAGFSASTQSMPGRTQYKSKLNLKKQDFGKGKYAEVCRQQSSACV